jgi:hypothetical protein
VVSTSAEPTTGSDHLALSLKNLQEEFEYDKDGRWSIEIVKEPTDKALLVPLVQKLLNHAPTQ